MLDIHDTWTANDLPTLESSEVSTLSPAQLRLLDDLDRDESGIRWLLERPEALLDVHRYGETLRRCDGRRASRKPTAHAR